MTSYPASTQPKKEPGRLYIISGPSGSGKTSLVRTITQNGTNTVCSVSVTTRPMRLEEQNHVHYRFVDTEQFTAMVNHHQFLEHAKIFDYYYGTPRDWVVDQQKKGMNIILEIDWQGAQQVRQKTPCTSIFILPPSKAALKQRLQQRNQDDQTSIKNRLQAAYEDITHYHEFDYLIVNDNFDQAVKELQLILSTQTLTPYKRQDSLNILLDEWLTLGYNRK